MQTEEKMACINKDRKLSDIDSRYYLAKDSIDYDFFELDDIERAVDEAIREKERDVNDDRLSMIAMCQSEDDDENDNADDDLVMGNRDLFGGGGNVGSGFTNVDACEVEEMQSAELFNCIAFAEDNRQEWVCFIFLLIDNPLPPTLSLKKVFIRSP